MSHNDKNSFSLIYTHFASDNVKQVPEKKTDEVHTRKCLTMTDDCERRPSFILMLYTEML